MSIFLTQTVKGSVLSRNHIICLRQHLALLILRADPNCLENLEYLENAFPPMGKAPSRMGQNLNNWTFPAHYVRWYRRGTASWERFKIKEVSSLKDKVEIWEEEGEEGICGETKTPATWGKGDGVWVWRRRREKGRSLPMFFWIMTTSTFNLTDSFVSPVLAHPVQMDLLGSSVHSRPPSWSLFLALRICLGISWKLALPILPRSLGEAPGLWKTP